MNNKFNFNIGWKFKKEDIPAAKAEDYDDTDWESVSLPHTFNDTDTFDNYMEGGHNGERSMFTGKTWYRKRFLLEESQKDKKILIEFEGVRQAAEVYINGVKLNGKSENGFIPFGYDLTPYVHFGSKPNIISVMVDNTFPYIAEGTDAVLSWHDSHWHPTHGGIYRNVYLYIKDKLHVTLPLYSFLGTQGVYAYNKNINLSSSDIVVEAEIKNDYEINKTAEIEVVVFDTDNKEVLILTEDCSFEAGEKRVVTLKGTLPNPHRWSPEFPYIYTVKTNIKLTEEIVDSLEIPFGIRTFEFPNNQGFFINGNHMKLKGWGQRPTNEWAGLGTAFPDWMHSYIQQLMKEAGANMIRWGHSAGAPADIAASDALGILTIQPGVDGEGSTVGGVYSPESYEVRIRAFRDMVIYFRNNPSIFIWEGGNQSVPDEEAKALRNIVQKWDAHGQRAYAHRRCDINMANYVDVSIGTEGSWELKSKGLPVVEGEYNREEAARRVWDRATPGYEDYHTAQGSAYDLTSEDLAKNQARHYEKISHPAHCGGANWIFSDSTSHGRVYSEVSRVSGAVDAVMLPKEAYYATKVIFRKDPQIHIIGHWNYKQGTIKDIYVMSNCSSVELFINGISLGLGDKSDTYLFTFRNIKWQPGEIKALGYSEDGAILCTQNKQTAGAPTHVKLTQITNSDGLSANGADILLIDVEVVDENGIRVPTCEAKVQFSLEGQGVWRGGYNSGKENSTNHMYLDLEAGINRVAVRTTTSAGLIRVTAEIDNLGSSALEVESKPAANSNGLASLVSPQKPLLMAEPSIGEGPIEKFETIDYEVNKEHVICDFSYSGIHEVGGVKYNANTGNRVYADVDYEFQFLPEYLLGSEYIMLPNGDRNYKALDLIHFSVTKDCEIYIAHDDLAERPVWLSSDFTKTNKRIFIMGHVHSIYKKNMSANSTVTLGGNQDEENAENCNMYVVFSK